MPDAHQRRSEIRASDAYSPDYALALVVGSSRINQVVVSKIVERAGLKVACEPLAAAKEVLTSRCPATIILDGRAEGEEGNAFIEAVASQRMLSGGKLPIVILLADVNDQGDAPAMVNAVVAKPITPDRLQPLIQTMLERVRD
jgi:CheY-like chemotaxis protein